MVVVLRVTRWGLWVVSLVCYRDWVLVEIGCVVFLQELFELFAKRNSFAVRNFLICGDLELVSYVGLARS